MLCARRVRGLTQVSRPGLLAMRFRLPALLVVEVGRRASVTLEARVLSSAIRWRGQRWP